MNIAFIRNFLVEREVIWAFNKLGHKTVMMPFKENRIENYKDIDIIFGMPWSSWDFGKIDKIKKRYKTKLVYWSRTHPNKDLMNCKRILNRADYIFTCYPIEYLNNEYEATYLPLCASGRQDRNFRHNYKRDVVTIMARIRSKEWEQRVHTIKVHEELKSQGIKQAVVGHSWNKSHLFDHIYIKEYENRFKVYWNSKISLNPSNYSTCLPLRHFESARCRCIRFLYDHECLDVFPDDSYIKIYVDQDPKEIVDMIKSCLNKNPVYSGIVKKAYEDVMNNHTYINRVKTILGVLK